MPEASDFPTVIFVFITLGFSKYSSLRKSVSSSSLSYKPLVLHWSLIGMVVKNRGGEFCNLPIKF